MDCPYITAIPETHLPTYINCCCPCVAIVLVLSKEINTPHVDPNVILDVNGYS